MFKRTNKYGAKKASCVMGHTHDSMAEARRCTTLQYRLKAGEIRNLVVQPQFWFVIDGKQMKHRNGRRIGYRADFQYVENGKVIVEEVKGFIVRDWPIRRALFEALFPKLELRELKK